MPAIVTVENHSTESAPSEDDIRRWISAALTHHRPESTIDVRLVDAAESAELNRHYRGKNGPTNVLAFAAELPAWLESPLHRGEENSVRLTRGFQVTPFGWRL